MPRPLFLFGFLALLRPQLARALLERHPFSVQLFDQRRGPFRLCAQVLRPPGKAVDFLLQLPVRRAQFFNFFLERLDFLAVPAPVLLDIRDGGFQRLDVLPRGETVQLDFPDLPREGVAPAVHLLAVAARRGKRFAQAAGLLLQRGGFFLRALPDFLLVGEAGVRRVLFRRKGFAVAAQRLQIGLRAPAFGIQADPLLLGGREFAGCRRQVGFCRRFLLLRLFQRGRGVRRPRPQFPGLPAEGLNLGSAAQKPGISGAGAAGQRAARIDDLPVQRDHAEPVAVFGGDGGGAVEVLGHGDAAEQKLHHAAVFLPEGAELRRQPHKAGAGGKARRRKRPAAHRAHRQEGRAPAADPLQISDCALRVPLAFDHNVLHGAAEGGLHGEGVFSGHAHQPGNRAAHAAQAAAARFAHHGLDALREALQVSLQVFQQAGAPEPFLKVQPQLFALFFGGLPALAPGLQLHPVPFGGVPERADALLRLREPVPELFRLRRKALLALPLLPPAFPDVREAQADLRDGGRRRRPGGFFLSGLCGQPGDFLGEALDSAGRLVHAAPELFQLF